MLCGICRSKYTRTNKLGLSIFWFPAFLLPPFVFITYRPIPPTWRRSFLLGSPRPGVHLRSKVPLAEQNRAAGATWEGKNVSSTHENNATCQSHMPQSCTPTEVSHQSSLIYRKQNLRSLLKDEVRQDYSVWKDAITGRTHNFSVKGSSSNLLFGEGVSTGSKTTRSRSWRLVYAGT